MIKPSFSCYFTEIIWLFEKMFVTLQLLNNKIIRLWRQKSNVRKEGVVMINEKYIRFDWAVKRMLCDKANFDVLEGLKNSYQG